MRLRLSAFFCLFVFIAASSLAQGENWPGWRGPRGDGTSRDKDAPLKWDGKSGENIVWKVPIPGKGHASPVIWEDRVLIVTCLEDSKERVLICLDNRGRKLWQKTVFKAPLETLHRLNSRASSTPATDGKHIYVNFLEVDGSTVPAPNVGRSRPITPGKMRVAKYDMQGNLIWVSRPGDFVSAHGYCSNPVLYKDLVIVNGDHDGESYIVALNQKDGKTAWRFKRKYGIRSYATPIIRDVDGRTQMVLSGSKCIVSLNPGNGKQHWRIEGPTEQFVASPVYDGNLFFMAAGFPTYHVMGIRPGGKGDVTDSHVAWHAKNAKCYVPSPVVVGPYLLVANDRGTANCFDTKTGERLWHERLGKHFSASLITANGLVYFVADDGETFIVKPGPELNVVATNSLGEYTFASPAIADGRLYIRGEKNLYCIGAK